MRRGEERGRWRLETGDWRERKGLVGQRKVGVSIRVEAKNYTFGRWIIIITATTVHRFWRWPLPSLDARAEHSRQ